jgi:uncharacterized membrane protein
MLYLVLIIGGGLVGALAVILNHREYRTLAVVGIGVAGLALTALFSVQFVPTGEIRMVRSFGVIQPHTITEGFKLKAPWTETESVNIQRQQIAVDSSGADAAVTSLTADQIDLDVDVNFPYRLNPQLVAVLYARVGGQERITQLLQNAGQSAVRDTLATLKWEQAAITDRNLFEQKLGETLREIVANDLTDAGLSDSDAAQAVIFFNPIIAQAAPPERLRRELEEKQAALVELQRQKTLTDIASEVANRRGAEGEGIASLLAKLPNSAKGFTPSEIADLINANAAETRAQALLKAVEAGKLNSITFSEQPSTTTTGK